jgi:hypothetical protein
MRRNGRGAGAARVEAIWGGRFGTLHRLKFSRALVVLEAPVAVKTDPSQRMTLILLSGTYSAIGDGDTILGIKVLVYQYMFRFFDSCSIVSSSLSCEESHPRKLQSPTEYQD